MLFGHPNISSLTISCAEIHEDYLQPVQDAARTPLKQLILMECNLTIEALRIMLSLPRALEELHLGITALSPSLILHWLIPSFRRELLSQMAEFTTISC